MSAKQHRKPASLHKLRRRPRPKFRLHLSRKTVRRIAEADAALDIAKGQGLGEIVLEGVLRDIIHDASKGFTPDILTNYRWDNAEKAKSTLVALALRWAKEDGKEAVQK